MLLRNHEHVHRSLRGDVAERKRMLVFGNELRRNLLAHYPAKQTVLSHQVSRSCSVGTRDSASLALTIAIAATAAVSNRNTFAPSDTGWKPEPTRPCCSADSRPPSGPTAMVTGGAMCWLSMGPPRASSTSREPLA